MNHIKGRPLPIVEKTSRSSCCKRTKSVFKNSRIMNKAQRVFNHLYQMVYEVTKTIVLSWVPLSWYPKKSVKDEIVLITGGANGLGRELAVRFATLGARLVIWDVDRTASDRTCRLVEAAGGRISSYIVDVSDRESVYETAERVKREVGKVDIVVNSAGIVYCKTLMKLDDADIVRLFDVNTLANFWVVKAFLPDMMSSNHGHVVSMSSISGCVGSDVLIDYSSSKHALNGFKESLAIHLAANGCDKVYTTNCCTYIIDTEMFRVMYDGMVPIMKLDYAVDQMMTAILTNTEVYYLPKLVYLMMWFRPVLSARALYHIQSSFSDRNSAKTIDVRKVAGLRNGSNGVASPKCKET